MIVALFLSWIMWMLVLWVVTGSKTFLIVSIISVALAASFACETLDR